MDLAVQERKKKKSDRSPDSEAQPRYSSATSVTRSTMFVTSAHRSTAHSTVGPYRS